MSLRNRAEKKKRRYGRGKFEAHKNYIDYMRFIVNHKNYKGMPNAKSKSGHINWQVSSGETTSFYKYYKARWKWWANKADELGIKGKGNSDDRFSITARLIHPTKLRPCRLCGQEKNVGYLYLNKNLAKRFNSLIGSELCSPGESIIESIDKLKKKLGFDSLKNGLSKLFPNLKIDFSSLDTIKKSFESSIHIRSKWLSPGFMSNPPDRLDGFHDYGLCCRKRKDPGRSDYNLKSYSHDRRAFNWWAEGDWKSADTLFFSADKGECTRCKKKGKVSPDHIGPLACGFKHIPFFNPLCGRCNSSKNRRLFASDVKMLIRIEDINRISAASWQVRKLWDSTKKKITTDSEARKLSNYMRGIEDYYLRTLYFLKSKGLIRFIVEFLSPELAHNRVTFSNLDRGKLSYSGINIKRKRTTGSISLEARIIRIAVDELDEYVTKPLKDRKFPKITKKLDEEGWSNIEEFIESISLTDSENEWVCCFTDNKTKEEKDKCIRELLRNKEFVKKSSYYDKLKNMLIEHFEEISKKIVENFFD